MADGILIFASKRVGLELTRYVLERGDPVRCVVVSARDDDALIALASRHGVPVAVHDAETQRHLVASGERFAWLLNFWSAHILEPGVLALAERRLNVHPSLVPHCRGNDNAAWTLRRRLPAGVSLIEMSAGVDAGDVWAQQAVECQFPVTGRQLHERLIDEAIALFKQRWPALVSNVPSPQPQSGPVTAFRRRDTEADRVLPSDTMMRLDDFVQWSLAHDFSPGTTAEMLRGGRRYRIRLHIEEVSSP